MIRARPNVIVKIGNGGRRYSNSMVQYGLDWLLDLAAGLSPAGITHIAAGDDGTAVSLGDTQLRNELVRKVVTTVDQDIGTVIAEVFFRQGGGQLPMAGGWPFCRRNGSAEQRHPASPGGGQRGQGQQADGDDYLGNRGSECLGG